MYKINYLTLLPVKTFIIISVVLALSSCGYHLSGNTVNQGKQFSPVLKHVSLQGLKRYHPLRKTIKRYLQSYDIKVTAPSSQTANISIVNHSITDNTIVIGDHARSREQLLVLTVGFYLIYKDQYLLRDKVISLEDTYLYNSNDPQFNKNERNKLLDTLYQRVTQLLMDQLATIKYNKAQITKNKRNNQ